MCTGHACFRTDPFVCAFPLRSVRWRTGKPRRRRDGLQPADKAGQDDLGGCGQTGMYSIHTGTIVQRLSSGHVSLICMHLLKLAETTLVKTPFHSTNAAVTACCWLDACVQACDALVVQDACVLGMPPRLFIS